MFFFTVSGSIQVNLEWIKIQSKLGGQTCESRAEQRSEKKGCRTEKMVKAVVVWFKGCWKIHQLWSNGGFQLLKLFYFFTPYKFFNFSFFGAHNFGENKTVNRTSLLKTPMVISYTQTNIQTDHSFCGPSARFCLRPVYWPRGFFLARLLFVWETLSTCLHFLCLIC